ncbi:hypothetical protein [Streptomyces sp. NPDC059575]|uniref:hypothetical protein n=1 Tax=Streptomyces sp. NPDC059575 TaxID=3346872 RepID=UPI00367A8272
MPAIRVQFTEPLPATSDQHKDQADEQPPVLRVFRPPVALTEARHLATWQWYRLATEWPDDFEHLVSRPRTRA